MLVPGTIKCMSQLTIGIEKTKSRSLKISKYRKLKISKKMETKKFFLIFLNLKVFDLKIGIDIKKLFLSHELMRF